MSKVLKTPANITAVVRRSIEIVLVLLLAFIGLRTLLSLNASDTDQGEGASATVLDQPVLPADAVFDDNYGVLVASNPFLGQDRSGQIDNVAVLNAPETSLNLTLKGVRAVGDGKGVAFILLPDGNQVLARIGSEILEGVEVEYVFEDRVTLRTREGLETLYWRDPENRAAAARPEDIDQVTEEDGQLILHGDNVSAKRFVSDVSFVRVEDNGAPVGYRLTPKRQSGALQIAGFQDGDIILEVNEFPVSEIGGEELQELLQIATVFEFYIERDEKTERVIVEFEQGVEN